MSHNPIVDQDDLVERYLSHTLSVRDRADFEAHLVDCQECRDRLLLAEMFHVRVAKNGSTHEEPAAKKSVATKLPETPSPEIPLRARFVANLSPIQILLILLTAAILLLALPTFYFLWQLRHL